MTLIQAPRTISTVDDWHQPSVFLAGGISGTTNWQNILIEKIDSAVTVFNPRQENFDVKNPNAAEAQILWEYRNLNEADAIIMWFCAATLCPICLYELGKWINSTNKRAIVGIEPGYARAQDVVIQTRIARPDVTVFEAPMLEAMQYFANWISNNAK